MKKRIGIVAMVCITMLFSMASVFAEELPGEDVNNTPAEQVQQESASDENGLPSTTAEPEQAQEPAATPEAQAAPKHISFDIAFTAGADVAVLGDTVWTEVTFQNYGDDFDCTARWLINGGPAYGFQNDNFHVYDGKTSFMGKYISEDFRGWGDIRIGFEILINGESFYQINRTVRIKDLAYSDADINRVLSMVKPVRVEATLNQTSALYSDVECTRKTGTVAYGTKVICINSKTGFSNKISLPDGRVGWVPVGALNVSTKNYTKSTDFSNIDKNIFVNAKDYTSKTDFLIWINLERQRVNVFKGGRGKWSIEVSFPCATGRNVTPTINGVFEYYAKQSRWTYPNYYVGPVMIFSGNYAMHSVLLNYDGSVYDGTLGRPASNGCVRLSKHGINWLSENIPFGTTVVVY